jgi:hypothetical protein
MAILFLRCQVNKAAMLFLFALPALAQFLLFAEIGFRNNSIIILQKKKDFQRFIYSSARISVKLPE